MDTVTSGGCLLNASLDSEDVPELDSLSGVAGAVITGAACRTYLANIFDTVRYAVEEESELCCSWINSCELCYLSKTACFNNFYMNPKLCPFDV